jgi:RecB family exonuclease
MNIRGSEIQDFLRCRKRWDYRWQERLISKKKNDKLFFGELFHLYLEKYYKTKNHDTAQQYMLQTLDMYMDEDWEELQDKLIEITNHYYETYKTDLFTVIGVEVQFSIPLTATKNFTGTIDLIYRDTEGRLWFADHKTTTSIEKYEKNAILDRQINRYWWAIQQLAKGNGIIMGDKNILLDNPYGFMYNIIYKDYPVPPKTLKSGGLSKDKSQKTTYQMYKKAITDLQLNEADYTEILEHLSSFPFKFFSRVEVFRNQQEIDCTMEEIGAIVQDMDNCRTYRNITTDCQWDCQYKDLCLAEIDGSDAQWLRDELYEKGEKEDDTDD